MLSFLTAKVLAIERSKNWISKQSNDKEILNGNNQKSIIKCQADID